MWTSNTEVLLDGGARRVSIGCDQQALAYSVALDAWQHDADFRRFFISVLAAAPFPAYFWETPAVTKPTADRPFEFVLVDSPSLARMRADGSDFASYFDSDDAVDGVVGFQNLGGDAFLVAPCPQARERAYTHLAAFVRQAPEGQQHALWRAVGAAVAQRLDKRPLWLSTSGSGVPWLHVRLDSRPKYYTYPPYRQGA